MVHGVQQKSLKKEANHQGTNSVLKPCILLEIYPLQTYMQIKHDTSETDRGPGNIPYVFRVASILKLCQIKLIFLTTFSSHTTMIVGVWHVLSVRQKIFCNQKCKVQATGGSWGHAPPLRKFLFLGAWKCFFPPFPEDSLRNQRGKPLRACNEIISYYIRS